MWPHLHSHTSGWRRLKFSGVKLAEGAARNCLIQAMLASFRTISTMFVRIWPILAPIRPISGERGSVGPNSTSFRLPCPADFGQCC